MNKYNIYIENDTELYTIFETSETDLKRVIDTYEIGKEDVFINGRKYVLKGLKEIRVFDMSKLQGSFNEFVNSSEAKAFHQFQGNRISGLEIPALYMMGKDLTQDFITKDYGWKKQIEEATILNQVSSVPVAHLQKILKLLMALDNTYGFKSTDFAAPEPSDLDTPHVGWRLRLKNFPKYYFFFKEVGEVVFIKHLP